MKTTLDIVDELNALADLQYSAFMAANCFSGLERNAISQLLHVIHLRTKEIRDDLAASKCSDHYDTEAA